MSSAKKVAELRNLGAASAKMLSSVSIETEEDLKRVGSLEAFRKMREKGLNPSLNMLYAMEGALTGEKWNQISLDRRMELDMQANFKRELYRKS